MKNKYILLFLFSLCSMFAINAAKIVISKGLSDNSMQAAIYWNGGSSGFEEIGPRRNPIFSSPWNKDINLIRWSEFNPKTQKVNYYTFHVHIPTVRAPWLKNPSLTIYDNGFIHFNDGQKGGDRTIRPDGAIQQKLGEEWAVID